MRISNDEEHAAALEEAARLWDFPEGTPESADLDALATVIEDYERRRWPIGDRRVVWLVPVIVGVLVALGAVFLVLIWW